jgi:hypothetical protein
MQVATVDRQTGDKLSSFGRPGRMAGNFRWVHKMTIIQGHHLYGRGSVTAGARRSSSGRIDAGDAFARPESGCCPKLH